jgi:hypothetical protein
MTDFWNAAEKPDGRVANCQEANAMLTEPDAIAATLADVAANG